MPLRLFADRERAGALAARALFNGALQSTFYFLTLYLQGVSGNSPFQTGLAFLPQTAIGFLIAAAVIALAITLLAARSRAPIRGGQVRRSRPGDRPAGASAAARFRRARSAQRRSS
jgi:hypothetical protein